MITLYRNSEWFIGENYWPEYVPYLRAENICRNDYANYNLPCCFCLSHWVCYIFGINTEGHNAFLDKLNEITLKRKINPLYQWRKVGAMAYLILLSGDNEEEVTAALFNEVCRKLGYCVYFDSYWEETL